MPRVTFDLNIGSRDCRRLDLDPEAARAGKTLDVSDGVADELIKNHWARPARASEPEPAAARPAEPATAPDGKSAKGGR